MQRAFPYLPIAVAGVILATGAALAAACSPASVTEAEARHDVGWLVAHPNREAMEALGRLADHDANAATAISGRRERDGKGSADVQHAAWLAHARGAAWGTSVLHAALSSAEDFPVAVDELPPRDSRLQAFADDLAKGTPRADARHGAAAVSLLASLGPASQPRLRALLDRPESREAVCTGLASPHATSDARMTLTSASAEARAVPACQQTLFQHAATDPRVLAWLGTSAETPLLAAASEALACPTLASVWDRVFASNRETLTDLEGPLAASMARCASAMDPVTARALPSTRGARAAILHALGTDDVHAEQLEATCKQLPRLGHGRAVPEDVRSLASNVHQSRCKRLL